MNWIYEMPGWLFYILIFLVVFIVTFVIMVLEHKVGIIK